MFFSIISSLFTYICIVLAVAFFTLLERKGLSYIQIRKGPNKVGLMGLPQPIADAAKLLTKEITKPTMANYSPYFVAPVFSFILALLLWQLYPSMYSLSYFKWGVLFFLCVSGMNVYGTLLAGWASNSKYALLGSLRAIAQTISYEVSMALVLLFPLFLVGSFNFVEIKESQKFIWFSFLMIPVFLMWFVTCVAETNRAPFDFAEGESELVSGFNIEYGASGFALIFLAEYANILVMSLLSSLLFLGGSSFIIMESDLGFMFKVLFIAFAFIWVRASYPRFRYDLLMNLTWKGFLPASLSFLLLIAVLAYCLYF
uniref:NADH-ubiquinone oxidoreductase chain 1 n=1 Tax=Gemmuloborsonia moosai TaxID=651859 RepID=A0A344H1H1_GEMMO|nr:NADH dehydrogenase subunit 1 [Gemmuloborsonia moosai]AXA45236.1 NADH dehydrogenase subunit 1 [Gemmuloborsonia moosai]